MKMRSAGVAIAAVMLAVVCIAADGSWLKSVPDADRKRVNPLARQLDAVAARNATVGTHWGEGNGRVCGANGCSRRRMERFFGC